MSMIAASVLLSLVVLSLVVNLISLSVVLFTEKSLSKGMTILQLLLSIAPGAYILFFAFVLL